MKRETLAWVRKAEGDRVAARRLAEDPRFNDATCFHCQQAAEKYLKAVMHEYDMFVRRSDDALMDLINQLLSREPMVMRLRRAAGVLRRYRFDDLDIG